MGATRFRHLSGQSTANYGTKVVKLRAHFPWVDYLAKTGVGGVASGTVLSRRPRPDEHGTIAALTLGHRVGLRFASDEEAPGLAHRCAAGELASPADVKQQVRKWRPDHLRV
jgi:hypothetical protein